MRVRTCTKHVCSNRPHLYKRPIKTVHWMCVRCFGIRTSGRSHVSSPYAAWKFQRTMKNTVIMEPHYVFMYRIQCKFKCDLQAFVQLLLLNRFRPCVCKMVIFVVLLDRPFGKTKGKKLKTVCSSYYVLRVECVWVYVKRVRPESDLPSLMQYSADSPIFCILFTTICRSTTNITQCASAWSLDTHTNFMATQCNGSNSTASNNNAHVDIISETNAKFGLINVDVNINKIMHTRTKADKNRIEIDKKM